ncbi:hypothetical protein VFPFJ_03204 [Purpureocillium lilacinum]|uniref:Uncharacterized protein n=1 Tax=Purpureocillium lilacinum TaxID=33203 RepID=A0A179HN81_PURLI|nr:hypothetical protein VFPFJ_03204 [Purpureocillium lilacinum]OAQ81411.1 hypothetical protein VFPBJ_03995 [Purpureocillium lilacinum]OAQ91464.1 hypothetical protein VFPFJ_03204 [Purpureocillium lilacinum]
MQCVSPSQTASIRGAAYHPDVVVAFEAAAAFVAVVMVLVFVLDTPFLGSPGQGATGARVRTLPVVRGVHVLIAGPPAAKPSRARLALKVGRSVAGSAAMVVPRPPSRWEGPAACATFEVVVSRRHDWRMERMWSQRRVL